jgi:hypothetical protein
MTAKPRPAICPVCHGSGTVVNAHGLTDACPRCAVIAEHEYQIAKRREALDRLGATSDQVGKINMGREVNR